MKKIRKNKIVHNLRYLGNKFLENMVIIEKLFHFNVNSKNNNYYTKIYMLL